jgi:hypothetical protein
VSEHICEREVGLAERLLWMVFAPFEFIVMILGGVLLFLFWAVLLYLKALRGLFDRAVTLIVHRFRVGRISSSLDEKRAVPPVSETLARGPQLRARASWLN